MKRFFTLLFLLWTFIVHSGFGQSNIGLSTGNYAGVYGVYNNPAYIQNNFTFIDFSLVGAGVYVNNNFLFLRKEDHSIFKFLTLNPTFPTFIDENNKEKKVDDFYNKSLKNIYQEAFISGISYMQSFHRFGISISTRGRIFTRAKNISYELAKLIYEDLDYSPLHMVMFDNHIDQVIEQLSTTEIALGFSYNVYSQDYTKIDVGVSAKYIMPISGLKLYFDNMNYYLTNKNTLVINDLNGTLDASVPYDYATEETPGEGDWIKGKGIGLDVGVFYTQTKKYIRNSRRNKKNCQLKKIEYDYRIGISLNDVGNVTFNENSISHKFKNISTYWPEIHDIEYNNVYDVMEVISEHLTGNRHTTNTEKTSFSKRLPTFLNLQFDYNVLNNFLYVNSMWTHHIKAKHDGFEKPDYIAIMPRLEKLKWSVGVPISLFDYNHTQVGLHARYSFFTIGIQDIIPYLGFSDIKSADLYFSFHFFIGKGLCKRKSLGCNGYEYGIKKKY